MSLHEPEIHPTTTPCEEPITAELCKICGSSGYRREYDLGTWKFNERTASDVSIVRCLGCGIRRTTPSPRPNYGVRYDNDYSSQGLKFLPFYLDHIRTLLGLKYQEVAHGIFPKGAQILDYGCSTGVFLKLVSSMGFEAIGFDISEEAAERCRNDGLAALSGDFFGQVFEAGMFDVIHCSHVIEHVDDPPVYLTRFHDLLRSEGHLLLSCPNYASLGRLSKGPDWRGWDPDCHLWHFTLRQMCRLLETTGFQVVRVTTIDGNVPNSRLKRKALDVMASLRFGDCMMIIATPSKESSQLS